MYTYYVYPLYVLCTLCFIDSYRNDYTTDTQSKLIRFIIIIIITIIPFITGSVVVIERRKIYFLHIFNLKFSYLSVGGSL